MKTWLKVAIAVADLTLAGCASMSQGGYLQARGTKLILNGKPFVKVSVNKWDLLMQYLAPFGFTDELDPGSALTAAQKSLADLSERGLDVIRINGTPYWPRWLAETYYKDPDRYFSLYDRMLDDCDQHGIRVIVNIYFFPGTWCDLAHESLHDFMTQPDCESRRMLSVYLGELVGRYRDRPTVLFWELPNELNLLADLWFHLPEGVLQALEEAAEQRLLTPPVVRDERNHYTSDELAAFSRRLAEHIRSIDPNHLIGSGYAAPRPSAMHLLRAARSQSAERAWQPDGEQELAEYLRLTHPDPIDLISIHHYEAGETYLPDRQDGSMLVLAMFKRLADRIGKPMYVGECGPSPQLVAPVYMQPEAVAAVRQTLTVAERAGIPLVLFWNWDTFVQLDDPLALRPGRSDESIALITRAGTARAGG